MPASPPSPSSPPPPSTAPILRRSTWSASSPTKSPAASRRFPASAPSSSATAPPAPDPPQINMERFIANEVARRLEEMPCLRAILIGHSHGGANVTAVTAALADLYAPPIFAVDQSYERAPVALSDGGGGYAPVTHKTLDDAPGVQRLIIDAVMTWL